MDEKKKKYLIRAAILGGLGYQASAPRIPFDYEYVKKTLWESYAEVEDLITFHEYVVIVRNYLIRNINIFFGFEDFTPEEAIIPDDLFV